MTEIRVLVVDDDENIGAFISKVAGELGFIGRHVSNFCAFKTACAYFDPSAIFVDLQMPDADGIEILNELHRLGNRSEIFLISGFDERVLKSARDFGLSKGLQVRDVLPKPIEFSVLEACLKSLKRADAGPFSKEDLAAGLEKEELFARYQPKLSLSKDGDVIAGAEALVRWRHPVLGELSPARFIRMAETSGLIGRLTEYMLTVVAGQMRDWKKAGLEINMAVNLSALTLNNLGLPDRYAGIVRDFGIDPQEVTLELTETAVMSNVVDAAEVLTRFRLKGFGLSIDDFGTGFSSLVQLYRMPFNELKIDQTFVSKIVEDREAGTIVKVISYLAHELGMTVCAEGVETPEVLEFMRGLGCEKVQGNLIGKPLLPEEFKSLLNER